MATTYLTLTNSVLRELNETELTSSTFSSSRGIQTAVKDFINNEQYEDAINYEMEKSRNWHWMWSTFYFHKKHYGYIIALIKILPKFLSALLKTIFFKIVLLLN